MYRHHGATKRVGGKVTRYKNLASFNKECPSRGYKGNMCTVLNVRCTKDGGGLATVRSARLSEQFYRKGAKPTGTWLLHFNSCTVMKEHLRNRVSVVQAVRAQIPPALFGARRRRRR